MNILKSDCKQHLRIGIIIIEDCQIMPVKSQKLLGVYIDEHLNWTPHIDQLCATISSRISLLKQLAQYGPENI